MQQDPPWRNMRFWRRDPNQPEPKNGAQADTDTAASHGSKRKKRTSFSFKMLSSKLQAKDDMPQNHFSQDSYASSSTPQAEVNADMLQNHFSQDSNDSSSTPQAEGNGDMPQNHFTLDSNESSSMPQAEGNGDIPQNHFINQENDDVPIQYNAAVLPPLNEGVSGADISRPAPESQPSKSVKKQPKAQKGHAAAFAAFTKKGFRLRDILSPVSQNRGNEGSGNAPIANPSSGTGPAERKYEEAPETPQRKVAETGRACPMSKKDEFAKTKIPSLKPALSQSMSRSTVGFRPMSDSLYERTWEAPPDTGFKTETLRKELSAAYGIRRPDVQMAFDLADSADMAKTYCLAFCLAGMPTKDVQERVKEIVLGCNSSDAVLISRFANQETDLGWKVLTPYQKERKNKAIALHTSHASDNAQTLSPLPAGGASQGKISEEEEAEVAGAGIGVEYEDELTPEQPTSLDAEENLRARGAGNGVVYEQELTPEQQASLDAEEKAWTKRTKDKSPEDTLLVLGIPEQCFDAHKIYKHLCPSAETFTSYEERLQLHKYNIAMDALRKIKRPRTLQSMIGL